MKKFIMFAAILFVVGSVLSSSMLYAGWPTTDDHSKVLKVLEKVQK